LKAHFGVFKDEAGSGRDTESGGCEEKGLGIGLALLVVTGAYQGVEAIEEF
jgi:hypothetical protein